MTATDAVAISTITPSAPTLPPQANSFSTGVVGSPSGWRSVSAKAPTTSSEMTDWSSEPSAGAPLDLAVRPSAAGSRPSRPIAKA